MTIMDMVFSLPGSLDGALLLGYIVALVLGARLLELIARRHSTRGHRLASRGFTYHSEQDHYDCHQGARLSLHVIDHARRIAVYRAPESRCARCAHKASCTPHGDARHLYRPLAAWTETDVGRFHLHLSVVMFAAAAVLASVVLVKWGGQQGTGAFALAMAASAQQFRRGLQRTGPPAPSAETGNRSPAVDPPAR